MLRTLILAGVFAIVLTVASSVGSSPARAENPNGDLRQQVSEMRKVIQGLLADLEFNKTVNSDTRIRDLEERLRKLEGPAALGPAPLGEAPRVSSSFSPADPEGKFRYEVLSRLRAIEMQLKSIDDRLLSLENKQIKFTPGVDPATSSSIRLRNQSGRFATVYVNAIPYELVPDQVRTLYNQPSGLFNYEVRVDGWGVIQPLKSSRLNGTGDTLEITIYSR